MWWAINTHICLGKQAVCAGFQNESCSNSCPDVSPPCSSPPFFLLLQVYSTVQFRCINILWLISNPAGWETGCRFHLSWQNSTLDTTLNSFHAFSAELSCDSPHGTECSVYCSTWGNRTSSKELWMRWSPERQHVCISVLLGGFWWLGWLNLRLQEYPHCCSDQAVTSYCLVTLYFKGRMFFLLTFSVY